MLSALARLPFVSKMRAGQQGGGNRRFVLALLCVASFASTFNIFILVPILPEVVDDFGVGIAVGGLLTVAFSLVAGVGSIAVGPTIDRIGRQPIILAGLVIFAVSSVLSAVAPNFWVLVATRAFAGVGSAALMAAVLAAIGDYFPYNERGRAMAWVFSVNTAANLLALPASAVLADTVSWRLNFVFIAAISVIAAAFLWLMASSSTRSDDPNAEKIGFRQAIEIVLHERRTRMALLANYLNDIHWGIIFTFLAAYFTDVHGLPLSLAGIPGRRDQRFVRHRQQHRRSAR